MKKLLLSCMMLLGLTSLANAQTAPTREIKMEKTLEIEGSTLSETSYKKYTAHKVPDLLLDINPFSNENGYEKLVIEFADKTNGDWLFLASPNNYDGYQVIGGNSTKAEKNLTSYSKNRLVFQVGNLPKGASCNAVIVKDAYYTKGEVKTSYTIAGGNCTISTATAATAAGQKAFEYKNLSVAGYKTFTLTFSHPVSGSWILNCDGTETTIPEGCYSYTLDISGKTTSNISLTAGNGTFPQYNYLENVVLENNETKVLNATADDEIFALSKSNGFDSETGLQENGGWTFETPVDLSQWQYLVITTAKNAKTASSIVEITDNNGKKCGGDDNKYDGSKFRATFLDEWNNQNSLVIDLYGMYVNKGLDITQIKSLKINGSWGNNPKNVYLSNVYLTNQLPESMTPNGQYDTYHSGDIIRSYTADDLGETGKYGTICLPYTAAISGGFAYSIASASNNGITLKKEEGLLKAGKPYFYLAEDEISYNVNFFKADWTNDVDEPIENNGLIGTFSDNGNVPAGAYVLSNNSLYEVDSDIPFAANKAYVDITKVQNVAEGKAVIDFSDAEDATAVKGIEAAKSLQNAKFYDLSGREVSAPTRGLYIVNGKKVLVK